MKRYPATVIQTGPWQGAASSAEGWPGALQNREKGVLTGLSDGRLIALIAVALFTLSAWPLLLVHLPPLQDLPNHVATAHIVAHLDHHPQYIFNGLFKSNSLLTLWFQLVGGHGLFGAARAFTALVLAINAVALPLFLLRFVGRPGVPAATLFVWPLVHGFFVSMGMLNFAFAFALALILLTVLDRQREHPTLRRGLAIAALSGLLWYAHPFPLAIVGSLVALHAATRSSWRGRLRATLALVVPLAPAGLLSLMAAQQHLVKAEPGAPWGHSTFSYLNPWELVAHLWLDASGALTRWGSMTIVPALLLPYFVWKNRTGDAPRVAPARPVVGPLLFSAPALALLAATYVALPVMLSNWCYFNCRLVPFLWVALASRLPTTLPRPVALVLCACALTFSGVLGVDYVRLDRDRAAFTAGMDAVPARATLLPLLFKHRNTSDYTASLTHAWGYYTVEKDAAAPLVFAVERSYPITYRNFPPPALIPPALDQFAERYATAAQVCKVLHQVPLDAACVAAWRDIWSAFWREAEPRYTHLLTWAMPGEARPLIPERYRRTFAAGQLEIYARDIPAGGLPGRP